MIDIEKFICSLLADHPEGVAVRSDIHKALKEQGLEYKGGKIVPIEDKTELKESEDERDERIRKWIINEIKIKHHNLDEKNVDFVDKAIAWLEKQGEQKSVERKEFTSIPFGTDSELIEESITIPDGCVATIEGNKIHIKKKDKSATEAIKLNHIVDNTDTETTTAEVVLDDDIVSTLGKMLWAEVQHILDAELKNSAEIEITITAKDNKL